MRLPAYPLITVDPFFSIWSRSEKLYDDDTMLWYGRKKRISATISIDGKAYRFIGKGVQPAIEQTDRKVTPYITYYTFKNEQVQLDVRFYTPLLINELNCLSLPCSFIDCSVSSADGKIHEVSVKL